MKVIYLLVLSILLVAATIACTGTISAPATITDDWGREIHLETVPQRIVSHVPSITETLFALGLGDKIVGDSEYCDYPEAAKTKPKIGGYFTPNIESIVALNPDLVLTDGYALELMPRLEGLGIPFIVINPKDINDIMKDIELLGNITGTEERAAEINSDLKERVDAVWFKALISSYLPTVFYVFDATDTTKPWTAGPGSFVDSLITMAGGWNAAGQAQGPWIQFNMEELVNSNPDIIIVDSSHGTAAITPAQIKKLPGWQDMTAVKENRIYTIDGDLVNRAGPRIVQGLEEMAKILHPELFKD